MIHFLISIFLCTNFLQANDSSYVIDLAKDPEQAVAMIDFETQFTGVVTIKTLQLINSNETVDVENLDLVLNSWEFFLKHNCPLTLKAKDTCLVDINFLTFEFGHYRTSFRINSSSFNKRIRLRATAI